MAGAAGAASGGASGASATENGGGAGVGSGGEPDAGSGEEPARVSYLTTFTSFEDAAFYTTGATQVPDPAPARSLFIVVQSASNAVVVAQRVRVNGVEAAKLLAVGEDVQPSAPSALFLLPFPTDDQANVEVELSTMVVRCAISLFVAYGLHNTAGVDDSETLVTKTSGSMTVNVAAGGSVIAALAMATNSLSPSVDVPGLYGTGFTNVLEEGTPTLILVQASGSRIAGTQEVNIFATDSSFNFRAFAAAVH